MRAPQVALAMLLGGVLVGCGHTVAATEVMVIVDAEPGVRAQAQKLHVVVSGGADNAAERGAFDRTFSLSAGDLDWPVQTALVPMKGDASRVYEFVASALDADGNTVAQVRAVSGYVAHERLALRLLLEDRCIAKTCGSGLTCKAGACTNAKIDQAKLLPYSAASLQPTVMRAGQAKDGGARPAGRDGGGTDGGASDAGGASGTGSAGVGGTGGGSGVSGSGGGAAGSGSSGGSGDAGGAGGAGGSNACGQTNGCGVDYPCLEVLCPPSDAVCQDMGAPLQSYTCRGQFADWTVSDSPNTFTVNGNGTASDSRSRLVWQQLVDAGTYSWANAKIYCTGLSLAGGGWRLPTKAELESIVDFGKRGPSIDGTVFPSTPPTLFWSSSAYLGVSGHAWYVDFNVGSSFPNDTTDHRVRCVR